MSERSPEGILPQSRLALVPSPFIISGCACVFLNSYFQLGVPSYRGECRYKRDLVLFVFPSMLQGVLKNFKRLWWKHLQTFTPRVAVGWFMRGHEGVGFMVRLKCLGQWAS